MWFYAILFPDESGIHFPLFSFWYIYEKAVACYLLKYVNENSQYGVIHIGLHFKLNHKVSELLGMWKHL